MNRFIVLLLAFASLAAANENTYVISGTGDGYWGSQRFTEATFTFTFVADTHTFAHGTACCADIYTTASGTPASVEVSGFPGATLTGDQAIFVNNETRTGGIWHYNDPEYLTVTSSQFVTNDLSVVAGYIATGASYSYATSMPLSTGDTLYFTSVHDVYFQARPTATGGRPTADSVSPGSATISADTTQTFTFQASDWGGVSDLRGVNILIRDEPDFPAACWLYYQVSTATITVNYHGVWSEPVGIQSRGAMLTGDACTVDTKAVTVNLSGLYLTLTVPIHVTSGDNKTWLIDLNATNNENTSSGYVQVGAVTVESPGIPDFTFNVAPRTPVGVPLGQSLSYTINLQRIRGFDETVTFSASTTADHSGNSSQLSATFDPPAITGSGPAETTMTVSTSTSDPPDIYHVLVTATSPSRSHTDSTGPIEASNVAPTASISPDTGTGLSQTFTIEMTDRIGLAGMNLLIAPSLSGANACWIFFDRGPAMGDPLAIYLAGDDGAVWSKVGTVGFEGAAGTGAASNSQCTVSLSGATYSEGGSGSGTTTDNRILQIPITFKPGFAGTKTLFVRASNYAGYDTGYQALGGWTVQ